MLLHIRLGYHCLILLSNSAYIVYHGNWILYLPMRKFRAIGFDWGGVLFVYPGGDFMQVAADFLGITRETFSHAYFQHNHIMNKGGNVEEMWQHILRELGKEDELVSFLMFLQNRPPGKLDARMMSFVRLLKTQGWKLALLSNNSITGMTEALKHDLEVFDTVLFSPEIGYQKPEPQIFLELARRLEIDITELIFVDDAQKSLSTAEEVGYEPILHTNLETLITRFVELGILSERPKL